ncbi:MAG: hypothetical protein L6R28_11445 [Planctomycetes bacterium]|nr:hypothetical protein [Planctomycetota bacterium]
MDSQKFATWENGVWGTCESPLGQSIEGTDEEVERIYNEGGFGNKILTIGSELGFGLQVRKNHETHASLVEVSIGDTVAYVLIKDFPNLMDFLAKYGNLALVETLTCKDSLDLLFKVSEKWRKENER